MIELPALNTLKPVLSALALPPAPFLLMALIGARLATGRRRGIGAVLITLACAGVWLTACMGTAQWLQDTVLKPPPALDDANRQRLAAAGRDRPITAAIIVLGAGVHAREAEYGGANLTVQGMARLRYGIWLARATGLPLGFTGGVGWAQAGAVSEAQTAARIALQEYGVTLKWREAASRDTRENAALSVPLLRASGIHEVVLVTHAAHMRRAVRAFEQAVASTPGEPLRVTPAPMAFVASGDDQPVLRWLPSTQGYTAVFNLLHEAVGLMSGR